MIPSWPSSSTLHVVTSPCHHYIPVRQEATSPYLTAFSASIRFTFTHSSIVLTSVNPLDCPPRLSHNHHHRSCLGQSEQRARLGLTSTGPSALASLAVATQGPFWPFSQLASLFQIFRTQLYRRGEGSLATLCLRLTSQQLVCHLPLPTPATCDTTLTVTSLTHMISRVKWTHIGPPCGPAHLTLVSLT